MDGMQREKIEVLRKVDIAGGDPRWPASVQVERRTANKGGTDKTYINVLIAVGERKLFIPRRIAREVGEALMSVHADASKAYEDLLAAANSGPREVDNYSRRTSRGSHVRGKRREHSEEDW